jgi:hypothetical protein
MHGGRTNQEHAWQHADYLSCRIVATIVFSLAPAAYDGMKGREQCESQKQGLVGWQVSFFFWVHVMSKSYNDMFHGTKSES